MDSFLGDEDLLIDPTYPDLATYGKYYDYDLLGRSLHVRHRIFKEPLVYLHHYCVMYSLQISLLILLAIAVVLPTFWFLDMCSSIGRTLSNLFYTKLVANRVAKVQAHRQKYFLPEDVDRNAMVVCQAEAARYGIGHGSDRVPRDLSDYEAIRFVFQKPWLWNKTHEALFNSEMEKGWDIPIEGELEEAIQEAMAEKRIKQRKPLPPALEKERRRMLHESDLIASGKRVLSRLRGIYDWEDFYRETKLAAINESYRWWYTQQKRLPLESVEVRARLKMMYEKSKEVKASFFMPMEIKNPEVPQPNEKRASKMIISQKLKVQAPKDIKRLHLTDSEDESDRSSLIRNKDPKARVSR